MQSSSSAGVVGHKRRREYDNEDDGCYASASLTVSASATTEDIEKIRTYYVDLMSDTLQRKMTEVGIEPPETTKDVRFDIDGASVLRFSVTKGDCGTVVASIERADPRVGLAEGATWQDALDLAASFMAQVSVDKERKARM